MKKNLFLKLALFASLVTVTSLSAAAYFAQAGDIRDGLKVPVKGDSIASYYADGKSGKVRFSCVLKANSTKQTVTGLLTSGKNFSGPGNSTAILNEGRNGPYTWELTNQNERNGNIKVRLIQDSTKEGATIQCKGSFI